MTQQIRWGVYIADLNPMEGSEQPGTRPVIVVSNEDFNQLMPVVTVFPLTSRKPGRGVYPAEVLLKKGEANLEDDCLVLAHQIRTISKNRLGKLIGILDDETSRKDIYCAIKLHLDLE